MANHGSPREKKILLEHATSVNLYIRSLYDVSRTTRFSEHRVCLRARGVFQRLTGV